MLSVVYLKSMHAQGMIRTTTGRVPTKFFLLVTIFSHVCALAFAFSLPSLTIPNGRSNTFPLGVSSKEVLPETSSTTTATTTIPTSEITCQFCSETFTSRNALFRHLRNSEDCARKASSASGGNGKFSPFVMERNNIILSIAYDAFQFDASSSSSSSADEYPSEVSKEEALVTDTIRMDSFDSDAKITGSTVRDAFQYALNEFYKDEIKSDPDLQPTVVSSTQTSIASLRHHSLSQENGVGACGEVMSLSYMHPVRGTLGNENKAFQESEKDRVLERLLEIVEEYLDNKVLRVIHDNADGDVKEIYTPNIASIISDIVILSAKNLPKTSQIHAETGCTQRVYHYLLPLRWLEGGKEVESWWLENRNELWKDQIGTASAKQSTPNHSFGEMRAKTPPPNDTLRKLKEALRSAECKRVDKNTRDELSSGEDNKLATNRYGVLGMKCRRPWHNFADPSLKGDASPSNKPVWRVLDRCRIVQFVPFDIPNHDGNGANVETQVMVTIEFRGDDFVAQQAKRIIGSAVAITNDWLPADFIQSATQPDVFIETPLAPDNRMYFAEARFHFDELIQGKKIFEDVGTDTDEDTNDNSSPIGKSVESSMVKIQEKIVRRQSTLHSQMKESLWLSNLRHDISPRITEQMEKMSSENEKVGGSYVNDEKEMPFVYKKSLSLLREIIEEGKWPSTSAARSRVIKKDDNQTRNKGTNNQNSGGENEIPNVIDSKGIESGSFTVINPKFQNGALMNNSNLRVPLGNQLFSELVEAIFELEECFSNDPQSGVYKRPTSSHCAVNRNAQFTPHVDSGRGAGQSLSMICGLGDYNGGELMIEGEPADIRYIAKEFDGWKQRHWTAPFVGERYSLVWFTPEM